jgi:hypothetical protein
MLVQLCTLPWLGFVPDDVTSAPSAAVDRLADRLGVDPAALSLYGQRAQTRSDHLGKVAEYLGWKTAPAGSREMKELEQFLLDRAMEHDSPTLLFSLARVPGVGEGDPARRDRAGEDGRDGPQGGG